MDESIGIAEKTPFSFSASLPYNLADKSIFTKVIWGAEATQQK